MGDYTQVIIKSELASNAEYPELFDYLFGKSEKLDKKISKKYEGEGIEMWREDIVCKNDREEDEDELEYKSFATYRRGCNEIFMTQYGKDYNRDGYFCHDFINWICPYLRPCNYVIGWVIPEVDHPKSIIKNCNKLRAYLKKIDHYRRYWKYISHSPQEKYDNFFLLDTPLLTEFCIETFGDDYFL